jgi:hypothetical protein
MILTPRHLQLDSGLCRGSRRCVNLHGHRRGCHHGAVIIPFVHVSYSQLNSIAVVFQKKNDGADPFNVKVFFVCCILCLSLQTVKRCKVKLHWQTC